LKNFIVMRSKPELIFTLPNVMGGVSSFNYNIINNSELKKSAYLRVILIKELSDKRPVFQDEFIADEIIYFEYSKYENKYYVQKRLNKLFGTKNGSIITDNDLTISTAIRFKSNKTLFHIIHDFFYVKQNIYYADNIDVAIAHSSFFSDCILSSDPNSFNGRCFYLPYGVASIEIKYKKNKGNLNLVFLGRLDHGKGVLSLKIIDNILKKRGIKVNWVVIGKGPLKNNLLQQWMDNDNINFFEPDKTNDVLEILQKQDLFIFPTTFEGTPVSIIECLSVGVGIIVNDLPGGIRDIVNEKVGFRCKINDYTEFADRISYLNDNRVLLDEMNKNCLELFNKFYQIKHNADKYFELFLNFENFKRQVVNAKKIKYSFFDNPFVPNLITKTLRFIKNERRLSNKRLNDCI